MMGAGDEAEARVLDAAAVEVAPVVDEMDPYKLSDMEVRVRLRRLAIGMGLALVAGLLCLSFSEAPWVKPIGGDIVKAAPTGNWTYAGESYFFHWFLAPYGYNQGISCAQGSLLFSNNFELFQVERGAKSIGDVAARTKVIPIDDDDDCNFNHVGDFSIDTTGQRIIAALESGEGCVNRFADISVSPDGFKVTGTYELTAPGSCPYAAWDESRNLVYTSNFSDCSLLAAYDATTFARIEASDIVLDRALNSIQGGAVSSDGNVMLSLGAFGDTEQFVVSVDRISGVVTTELELGFDAEMEGVALCEAEGVPGSMHVVYAWRYGSMITLVTVSLMIIIGWTVTLIILLRPIRRQVVYNSSAGEIAFWTAVMIFIIPVGMLIGLFAGSPTHVVVHFQPAA